MNKMHKCSETFLCSPDCSHPKYFQATNLPEKRKEKTQKFISKTIRTLTQNSCFSERIHMMKQHFSRFFKGFSFLIFLFLTNEQNIFVVPPSTFNKNLNNDRDVVAHIKKKCVERNIFKSNVKIIRQSPVFCFFHA